MLDVRMLGQFEVRQDKRHLLLPTRNAQSLFAYLVLNVGKAFRREKLAGLLWPDSSEDNARSNLRHELWRLRKSLESGGDVYFTVDDLTIAFNPQCEHSVDVHKLIGIKLENSVVSDLADILSYYQGELLPGFYEEWVQAERDRLAALFEGGMTRLIAALLKESRWDEVLEWATRWIGLSKLPEPAYRALMLAYANTGDLSRAASTYERFYHGLQNDLGVRPSEQTQELYRRLKAGWKPDIPLKPSIVKNQTDHKGADKPASGFSLSPVRRPHLPNPLTSFIGRGKEIQQVEQLVSRSRLVTITGSGGVGKTRLVIQAASALAHEFRDGTWWVELAGLFKTAPPRPRQSATRPVPVKLAKGFASLDSDLVAQAVARTLRIPEAPGLSLLEEIVKYLHDRQLLLVIDNCEHLIDDCASLVVRLLDDCQAITIMATSREVLGVPGEKAWRLPSLSLPKTGLTKAGEIYHSEAVKLFIDRAADVLPGYQPGADDAQAVAQICQRLEGNPLAIELAAARMNLLSPQEILARLDRRFNLLVSGHRMEQPRHQTLQAAIEWSYDLLNGSERQLFRCLSIFAGSFSLDAAEYVCADYGIRKDDVLGLIGRLVDKSLLNVESRSPSTEFTTRYRFLDSIRSFGRLKADEAGETRQMRRTYADYYVHLVEAAEPELNLENQNRWYELLKAENDNLRAAVEWSAQDGRAESALRVVSALLWYWYKSGLNREGRDLALKALETPSAPEDKEIRAKALNTAGFMQCMQGDTVIARQMLAEALSIFRESGNEAGLAWTLQFLGLALAYDKEYDRADAALKEGVEITRKLIHIKADSFLFFLGDVELMKGDTSKAKRIYEESVTFLQLIGNKSFQAYPLRRLGYLAIEQMDFKMAEKYFRESLSLNLSVRDMPGVTASFLSMAILAIRLNKPATAARLYGIVESRLESLSINLLFTDQVELERIRSQMSAYFDEAVFKAFTEGWDMNEEQALKQVADREFWT